ncbi:hypothetical protein [Cognatiluteimonas weifangensis]|uniref:Uncharacterized protein n=1 Tax=Cognatiluteimonas weifangensis TaxID=2303539 RepID=A0A372DSG9_9GAMM|nr:hypothetical protein [Luteimonas weifangensis]RFP62526.1 hypothetical protein D0Y53_01555 [Luteimonas weifangensis]
MPDAQDPRGRGPADWGAAFAALPQETPPAAAWSRIAARLDTRDTDATPPATATAPAGMPPVATATRHRGRRRPARAVGWLGAAAAALALVIAWPRHDAAPVAPPPGSTAPVVASAARPALPASAIASKPPAISAAGSAAAAAVAAGSRKPDADAAAIALPEAVEAARKPRYAAHTTPAPDAAQPLDALYVESARLEALLALARDDRVASAGAALLSAELDAQVADIDARLARPGLDAAQRAALWQARVDALRQAAGFESTQRILAAQGDGGALLVSVD